METLPAVEDHLPYRFSLAMGGRGAVRRGQSADYSSADLGSSHHDRPDPRRPPALGCRRESPSGASRIHLRLAPGDRIGASGGMVSRRRRRRRSPRRGDLPDPEVSTLSALHSLVRPGRNLEGHDHHDRRLVSRLDQHGYRSESHRPGASQGRPRPRRKPTPDLHQSSDSGSVTQYLYRPQAGSRHGLDSGFHHRDRSHQGGTRIFALGILSVASGEAGVRLYDRLRYPRYPRHLVSSVARASDVSVETRLNHFGFWTLS